MRSRASRALGRLRDRYDEPILIVAALLGVLLIGLGVLAIAWDHSNSNLRRGQRQLSAQNARIEANADHLAQLAEALRASSLASCRRGNRRARDQNDFARTLRRLLRASIAQTRADLKVAPPARAAADRRAIRQTNELVRSIHDTVVVDCKTAVPKALKTGVELPPA